MSAAGVGAFAGAPSAVIASAILCTGAASLFGASAALIAAVMSAAGDAAMRGYPPDPFATYPQYVDIREGGAFADVNMWGPLSRVDEASVMAAVMLSSGAGVGFVAARPSISRDALDCDIRYDINSADVREGAGLATVDDARCASVADLSPLAEVEQLEEP